MLTNRGDGRFRAERHYRAGSPVSIAIGDLNADRAPDLAITNELGGTVSVFPNRGDGTFNQRLDYETGLPRVDRARRPEW